jgi:hypothetical protein
MLFLKSIESIEESDADILERWKQKPSVQFEIWLASEKMKAGGICRCAIQVMQKGSDVE